MQNHQTQQVNMLAGLCCLWLLVFFGAGCSLDKAIGEQLVKPDRGGTLAADTQIGWEEDAALDAMHTVTMPDGTRIACFVMEPWAYAVDWARDLPKHTTPDAAMQHLRQDAKTLAEQWGVDDLDGQFRLLNDLSSEGKVYRYNYRLLMPEKPWRSRDPDDADDKVYEPPVLKGTVVLLQGWQAPVVTVPYLRPLACVLSSAGYRVVMPDVRGQGASGGRFRGFGAQDARDMNQVVTALIEQDVVEGPLYAVGHSYGGMLALLWGLRDDRVQAVIALSPLHDAREAFPFAIRGLAKRSNSLASWLLDGFVSDQTLRAGFDHAGKIAGTDLTQATVIPVITASQTPVMMIHGQRDIVCNFDWSIKIWHAREEGTQIYLLPEHNHWSYLSKWDRLEGLVLNWLDRHGLEFHE